MPFVPWVVSEGKPVSAVAFFSFLSGADTVSGEIEGRRRIKDSVAEAALGLLVGPGGSFT